MNISNANNNNSTSELSPVANCRLPSILGTRTIIAVRIRTAAVVIPQPDPKAAPAIARTHIQLATGKREHRIRLDRAGLTRTYSAVIIVVVMLSTSSLHLLPAIYHSGRPVSISLQNCRYGTEPATVPLAAKE